VLLCLGGVGSLYRWLRDQLSAATPEALSYPRLNALAESAPVGAEGVSVLPFGNGPERLYENAALGASLHGIDLNRHGPGHLARAAQEGIAFAFRQGVEVMRAMGAGVDRVRAGRANLFLSDGFARAFATAVGAPVDLAETDGALGAARAAGVGAGTFASPEDAFASLRIERTVDPDLAQHDAYEAAYARWQAHLDAALAAARNHTSHTS
jgi:xylulokinase